MHTATTFLLPSTWFVTFSIVSGFECPRGGYNNNQTQFGPGCNYRCHCVADAQCDNDTGICQGGCAAGWMGPGCQYGDIAFKKRAWMSSNTGPDKVVDGDPSTCSQTDQIGEKWWRVDLNGLYRITGLIIFSDSPDALKGFKVRVGNVSSNSSADFPSTCFNDSSNANASEVITVLCTSELVGKHLMISIMDQQTKMKLCDVRVYGGRSIAYRRFTNQSSDQWDGVASRAVDGGTYTSYEYNTCTHTIEETSPRWMVDLAQVYYISRIEIFNRQDCCEERLAGFTISFATNGSFVMVYKHPHVMPAELTDVTNMSNDKARFIQIELTDTSKRTLSLCEVFIYGDCPDNLCGWSCEYPCYCAKPEDKINKIDGYCPTGCAENWTGSKCDLCYTDRGDMCVNICGKCRQGTLCNASDGTCVDGCQPGWWNLSCRSECNYCDKNTSCTQLEGMCSECSIGKWGPYCERSCIGCRVAIGCNISNGICLEGCLLGRFDVNCDKPCGHCGGDGSCDIDSGRCNNGCLPGWMNTTCTNGLHEADTSSSTLQIGISVGGALGAVGLTSIILFAILYWKRRGRAPQTSELEHTYNKIDKTLAQQETTSDYSKLEEMGLLPVILKDIEYENTYFVNNLIPKCEFRDHYQRYHSLDDKTGELRLLSLFKYIASPAPTKTGVTRTGGADDCIETLSTSYYFETKGKKEFTILSDFPTTSESIWRLALEQKAHLIIVIGENCIPLKPKVQIDIGLIQIECINITVERDLMLCNINLSECEKDTKMRNVQVILSAEGCSFCIASNINETVAVLKKRLRLRQGIEAFNTLIICTPDASNGEGFVASMLMTDVMEKSGYIDIIGIIEAMRKEKHDAINSFDKFKFCHDVIFKWITDEENRRRM